MTWQEKIFEKIKNIKNLRRERGSILVLTALLLPIMFGCLGIAYDVGNVYMHKARLQNVTDAAALAAGRAYLESQKKTTGIIDDVDENTSGKAEKEYVIGGSQTLSGNHQDADKAADDYIYNNIINLGETVYSDQYSHYALRGIKKNAAAEGQEATYTEASEIFYRVGLWEKVPLYFLSVITKKNVETVRAGSVVVLQPGTTSEGGLILKPNASFSIFDNLFTYSDWFFVDQSSKYNEGWIRMAFIGDMVYTHGTNPNNDAYYSPADTNLARHYYSVSGSFGGSSIEGKPIDDPTINTIFDITKYVSAFDKKLNRPHVDVTTLELKASQINEYYEDYYNKNSYNNVYHLGIKNSDAHHCAQSTLGGNFEINFDEELKGEEDIPIYIILDETTQSYKLKGTQNTRRPVVIACFAAVHMAIDNNFSVPCFKGVIYNPYMEDTPWHFQHEGQTFIGNVIAKKIKIDNSNGANIKFEQKNWLENTGIYVDADISEITQEIKRDNSDISSKLTPELREKIETIYKDIKILKEIVYWPEYKEIYEDVDVAGNIGNMEWFNNLSYEAKKLMYHRWRDYYNSHSDDPTRDLLWMWNGYFEDGGEEGGSENKTETLRLINYRTEYQAKENLGNDDVLDPFIFETLGKPDSY